MLRRLSIAEVQNAGVTLKPEEAIAIAQQLIHRPFLDLHRCDGAGPSRDAEHLDLSSVSGAPEGAQTKPRRVRRATHLSRVTPATPGATPSDARDGAHAPFGPPTPANVFLENDGTVSCAAYDATLAISEVARFLQEVLPFEASRIAGSLRYTVARALLEVDAPPFDSLEEFSQALARHERGDREMRVLSVLERARAAMAPEMAQTTPIVDRRRVMPEVFELRRQLRESDARLYDQQLALDAVGTIRSSPGRSRHFAVAAGLAIGLTMVGAGELMQSNRQATAAESRSSRLVPPVGASQIVRARSVATDMEPEPSLKGGAGPGRPRAITRDRRSGAVERDAVNRTSPLEEEGFRVPSGSEEHAAVSQGPAFLDGFRPAPGLQEEGFRETSTAAREAVNGTAPSPKRDRGAAASSKPPATNTRHTTTRTEGSSSGLLERLHLSWLKKKIVIRDDL